MSDTARVGSLISFEYPSSNYLFCRKRWERRLVRVDSIHDGPAPQEAVDADPLLNRAGKLIVGVDYCRHGAVRSFYLGAARNLHHIEGESIESVGGCGKKIESSSGRMDTRSISQEGQGGPNGGGAMQGEPLYRVDIRFSDGHEEPSQPCLSEAAARAFIDTFNLATPVTGHRAIGKEVELPRLKGNGARKLE